MSLDLARIRAETPGCARVLHLNAAGSSLPSRRTLDATLDHLKLEAEIGGYEAADQARDTLDGFYPSVARLIGAEESEIGFVENATRAWDLAFYSLDFKPGDRILTCVSEYSSNYISYLQVAKKTGAEIVVVPDDKHGQIDLAALERAIDKRTKLVSISHIPTQGGLVQPAEAVGKIVNDAGVLYLLDACQSVGMMPIDVKKIGCDFLSATGRKYMRGPRGTGFLYARTRSTSRIEPIFLDNHAARWTGDQEYTVLGDAKRFENWERYFAGVIGLKVAADQANELGMEAVWTRLRQLADGLRARLAKLNGVTLTDLGVGEGCYRNLRGQGRRTHGTQDGATRTGHQRVGVHAVLLAPRSQGPRLA
jgi:cysteine desulfurase/selenocysteine lyase